MRCVTSLPNLLQPAVVIMPRVQADRLADKCFRGSNCHRAGNFSRWHRAAQLFSDKLVWREFLLDVEDSIAELDDPSDNHFSVCITHQEVVGWASTAPVANYLTTDHHDYQISKRGTMRRINLDRHDLLAPQTTQLTIVYRLRFEEKDGWVVMINSLYPGQDIGDLEGDLTTSLGLVLFGWSHPGDTSVRTRELV